jgi:hypothetical protein
MLPDLVPAPLPETSPPRIGASAVSALPAIKGEFRQARPAKAADQGSSIGGIEQEDPRPAR